MDEETDVIYRTPGEVLGKHSKYAAGAGTHLRQQDVCASILGAQRIRNPPAGTTDQRQVIEIFRGQPLAAIPSTGALVTAKVTKVNPRVAVVDILCVGRHAAAGRFSGTVRQQDVRATEIDKVDMYKSFRPGDLIRAEVVSLGDGRSYFLSTAKNELGVVFAKSFAGAPLVPISWQEMQCSATKQKEFRKVAKVTG